MEHVADELLCSFRTRGVARNGTSRQTLDESGRGQAKELTLAITKLRLIVPGWNSEGRNGSSLSREGTGVRAGRSCGGSLSWCPWRRAPSRRPQTRECG